MQPIPEPVREAMGRMSAEEVVRQLREEAEDAAWNHTKYPAGGYDDFAAALLLAAQSVEREAQRGNT